MTLFGSFHTLLPLAVIRRGSPGGKRWYVTSRGSWEPWENFRFFDLKVYTLADPQVAIAEVKAEVLIKPKLRIYRQDYVLFLRAAGDKIVFPREDFDPVRAAKALDAPILGLGN